jgi:hypothetical protein
MRQRKTAILVALVAALPAVRVLQFFNKNTGVAFDGNLTTDNIAGTFGGWDCQIYCTGEQSDPLKFILTRNK